MKIYTRTGDKGKTSILGNSRVDKDDSRIETYGTIDELNAVLGLCYVKLPESLKKGTVLIQHLLFDIGMELAYEEYHPIITEDDVKILENYIDNSEEQLPPLSTFILPGGTEPAVHLHMARTVCRRAERCITKYAKVDKVNEQTMAFLNRLSDLFFSWSRLCNYMVGIEEIEWKKKEMR